MYVIKHGASYGTFICGGCGCVFEFDATDVDLQPAGENEYDAYITCPECGKTVLLEQNYNYADRMFAVMHDENPMKPVHTATLPMKE